MEQNRDRAEEYLVRIAEKVREMLGVDCFVKVMEVSSCGIIQPGIFIMPPKGLPSVSTVVGIIDMNNYGWDLTDPDGCAKKLVRMYAENKELLESHGFTENESKDSIYVESLFNLINGISLFITVKKYSLYFLIYFFSRAGLTKR